MITTKSPDMVRALIRMHAGDNEYSLWDAICFWFEIDPEGEEANYLRLINDPDVKLLTDFTVFIELLGNDQFYRNPFLDFGNRYLLKWIEDAPDILDDDKNVIDRFNVFYKEWNSVLSMLRRKENADEKISRDDLLRVASAMGKRPYFLFPEGDSLMMATSAEDGNHPTLLKIAIKAWGKYWPRDKKRPIKSEVIVSELQKEYGISDRAAKAVDLIIRPDDKKVGGHLK